MADTFTTILVAMWFPIPPLDSPKFPHWNDGFIYPVVAGLATIESKIECLKSYVVPLF
jgi:hypothetical protein